MAAAIQGKFLLSLCKCMNFNAETTPKNLVTSSIRKLTEVIRFLQTSIIQDGEAQRVC